MSDIPVAISRGDQPEALEEAGKTLEEVQAETAASVAAASGPTSAADEFHTSLPPVTQ